MALDEAAVKQLIDAALQQKDLVHQQELEQLKKQQEAALEASRQSIIKQEIASFSAPADKRAVEFIMRGQYDLEDLCERVKLLLNAEDSNNGNVSCPILLLLQDLFIYL